MKGVLNNENEIAIYQAESGALEIKIDNSTETIWLTQSQIATLFDKAISTISEHIKNIFEEGELLEIDSVRKFGNSENSFSKPINYYNLDIVLSVGYRTNSKKATKFRQWVSSVLKEYIQKGYALNKLLLEKNKGQIIEIQNTMKFLLEYKLSSDDYLVEILKQYSNSLITLNQFDEDRIELTAGQSGLIIDIDELNVLIAKTKIELITKNEASELFGKPIDKKFESTIGAIYQSFDGSDVYPSLEAKAAHLLYLIIKNHSFVDGNKRIGSIIFVYYLSKNNYLYNQNGRIKINENTLVALALLVAQSRPEDKDILVKLIIKLIQE